jgi:hypothetical protein
VTTNTLRFVTDENFNNDLLRALLRRLPNLDIIRVQNTAIAGADDPTLLAWAAAERRILLTHDVRADLPMPGVVEVAGNADPGDALDDLVVMISASDADEWPNQVRFVPLR